MTESQHERGTTNAPHFDVFLYFVYYKMYRGKNYLTKTPEGIEVNSKLYLESLERLKYEDIDALEGDGYKYFGGDNSYNYEDKRPLTQTMQRDLYIRKNPRGRGYNYAVAIYLHNGGDVRCNYSLAWIYKTNENCFRYLVWICDARHLGRMYHSQDFQLGNIKEFRKEL